MYNEYFESTVQGQSELGREAATKFLLDTIQHPDARLRQVAAVVEGGIVGGVKAIPDQIVNHPLETGSQALIAAGTGALFGMATKIKNPLVAGSLALGGAAMTYGYANEVACRLSANRELQSALGNVWINGDASSLRTILPAMENSLGKETFELAVASLAGSAGFHGIQTRFTLPVRKLCLADESTAENFAQVSEQPFSTDKPDNSYAMVWHQDRLGYQWNKLDPASLEAIVRSTPLHKRLDSIEKFIKEDKLFEAYDHAEANLKWHNDKSDKYSDEQYLIGQQFYKIAMCIRNSWEDKVWLDKAFHHINETKGKFGDNTSWTLKVSPDKLLKYDRLCNTSLEQRADEIVSLLDAKLYGDAAKLANMNYLLHRDTTHGFFGSKRIGTSNELFDEKLADDFDMIHLHILRLSQGWAKDLVPHTDVPTVRGMLQEIKTKN